MPGHRTDNIIFKQPQLREKYTCPYCHLLLKDAVQPCCGHWLCQTCADEIGQENDPCCPKEECGEQFAPDDEYFPDRFVRKEILGLTVSCKYSHIGCDWEGKFSGLQEHLTEECVYNLTKCEFCKEAFPCDKLESHRAECSMVPKDCPLATLGCKSAKLSPQELADHLEFNKYEHMKLFTIKILSLEEKLKERSALQLPTKVRAEVMTKASDRRVEPEGQDLGYESLLLSKTLEVVEADGPGAHTPMSSYYASRNIMKKGLEPEIAMRVADTTGMPAYPLEKKRLDQEIARMQTELKASILQEMRGKDDEITALKSTVSKLEKMVRSKTADIEDRDFRLSLIENSNHDGTMVWKIPQFSQRMDDAKSGKYTSIFSLPFYTGRYGYKMCLRLYILGDGIGKGSYMSLFFVLMKGEFDNILQWPFTHKVTFKLINQNGGRDVVDTFQPDPMSSSFRKPKSDMNIASGCPRFVTHANLTNSGFIADDTIFIKCIIDTATIRHP